MHKEKQNETPQKLHKKDVRKIMRDSVRNPILSISLRKIEFSLNGKVLVATARSVLKVGKKRL